MLRVIEFDKPVTGTIIGISMDGNFIELPRQIVGTNLKKQGYLSAV